MCLSGSPKESDSPGRQRSSQNDGNPEADYKKPKHKVHQCMGECDSPDDGNSDESIYSMQTMTRKSQHFADILVKTETGTTSQHIHFQLDTGATCKLK